MKCSRLFLFVMAMEFVPGLVSGQQNIVYNHYFFNPFLYNPSLTTPHDQPELFLSYRKQWLGIHDGPSTALVNLQAPINYKMSYGATALQENVGVLKTTTGMLAFGYQIYFGNNAETGHKVGFGLSAGFSNTRIDINKVSNPDDPALGGNSTSSMKGQFGLHYQYRKFKAGFALPSIFKNNIASEENFNKPGMDQLSATLSTLTYTFSVTRRVTFEPTLLYRTEKNLRQVEGIAVFKIDELLWVGGSYRQGYGPSGFLQLNIHNKIKVGYGYEFSSGQLNGFNNASHEFQIAVRLGKKKSDPVTKVETQEEETQEKTITAMEAEPVQKPILEDTKVAEEPVQPIPVKQPLPAVADEQTLKKDMIPKKINGETLEPGYYIVVGVFHVYLNANQYLHTLKRAGYPAEMGYYPSRANYIIYMKKTATIEEAKKARDQYRARSRYSFKDTWIFLVQ